MNSPNNSILPKGYKMTELGPLPEEWEVVAFEKCIKKEASKVGKVKQQEYKVYGKYPIIDQGQSLIAGYCDNEKYVYEGRLPVIIFGDHTRILKFIDFPFVTGADGTKVLTPNTFVILPEFFYFVLLNIKIPNRGYNRHYSLLREQKLPLPPLPEQQKIAVVLSAVQEAKEKTEAVIDATKTLKKSMMKHLFTYGPVSPEEAENVPLKETEIGKVPEEWEVVKLGECLNLLSNGTTKEQNKLGKGLPVSRIETISTGEINSQKVGYVEKLSDVEIEKYKLKVGDILFSHINSEPYLGNSAIYKNKPKILIHGMNLLLLRTKEILLDSSFLNFLFNYYRQNKIFIKIASRSVNQSSINQGKIRALQIPLPPLPVQQKIASILSAIDEKIQAEEAKEKALEDLFRSLLSNLISGKIRVKDLEVKV
jgi:type I restriction enzyme S subunit